MSRSPIPGAIVPVSAEKYGTSRLGCGTTGACGGREATVWGGSRMGRALGCPAAGRPGTGAVAVTGRLVVSAAGTPGRGRRGRLLPFDLVYRQLDLVTPRRGDR